MPKRLCRFICAAAVALGELWAWSAAGRSTAWAADLKSIYIGAIETHEAWIGWGLVGPNGNTIGRSSKPLGEAVVEIGGKVHNTKLNWMRVTGLEPDKTYPFRVQVNGRTFGEGSLRTHAERATKLRFFVMGDFGSGGRPQYRVAEAMWTEFERHEKTDNPVRFLITTGDNIYGLQFGLYTRSSGDRDKHWLTRYYAPYDKLLRRIPFYPSLGNHDGNESENRGDLDVYMDNFGFPGYQPARWYQFRYANLAEFFALDSTENSLGGKKAWQPGGEQEKWLKDHLSAAATPWRIAYWHHPPFTAGPLHDASLPWMKSAVELLGQNGVQVAFNGHEHNLQISRRNEATHGVQYIVSGSAGELREEGVQSLLNVTNMLAWSPQRQFLSVEIDGDVMRVQPIGFERIRAVTAEGEELPLPFSIPRNK